jgi:thiopeptide-type bacteriocin biosynthesis protein
VNTGSPVQSKQPRWQETRAAARALLDEPAVRERVCLRVAPSLLTGKSRYVWLTLGGDTEVSAESPGARRNLAEERWCAREPWLDRLVRATAAWHPWPAVRALVSQRDGSADDVLLSLVEEGLLHVDIVPALVGPPAPAALDAYLRARGLSGHVPPAEDAVLAFEGRVELPTNVVTRAAALVPLLTRLQSALGLPASERHDLGGWQDGIATVAALHGAGRVPLGALAAGDFGVAPEEKDPSPEPGSRFFAWLGAAVGAAVARGDHELVLDADTLDLLLPPAPAPLTAELFLSPRSRASRKTSDGVEASGWLLGLHAPAGASWGRFLHALSDEARARLAPTLATLVAAEKAAAPGEESIDVAYAATASLADLGHHPPLRARCLALTSWPAPGQEAIRPADLGLVVEEGTDGASGVALATDHQTLVAPRPLHRVRSHTAPAGVFRLLAGWTLGRQHAPWVAPLGPLAEWPTLPRLVLGGFVISPRAWRLPGAPCDLRRWRRREGIPRWVQAGEGDELLPVDLDADDAPGDLAGVQHVFELWPAPEALPDEAGRRVEAVVAVVAAGHDEAAARRARRNQRWAAHDDVAEASPGWTTFKIFGAPEHQDDVLREIVAPLVAARKGRAGHQPPTAWFFQRYVEGPGTRHHLRLRLRVDDDARWATQLRHALAPAYEAGAVVGLESGPYVPERGRFGASSLDLVHALFQAQSAAVLDVLARGAFETTEISLPLLVRLFEAFTEGFALDAAAREELARKRFAAEEEADPSEEETARLRDRLFRRLRPGLRLALGAPVTEGRDGITPVLQRLGAATRRARRESRLRDRADDAKAEAALLPALLHLLAVRLLGPDRAAEQSAYLLWARTHEGLRRAPVGLNR